MNNITEIISSLPEESFIAVLAFLSTGIFYIIRQFSTLKNQIRNYEQQEISTRESLENELELVQGIISDLRYENENTRDEIEEELVAHEMNSLSVSPRFDQIGNNIANFMDAQSDLIIETERILTRINNDITDSGNQHELSTQLKQVNSMFGSIIELARKTNTEIGIHSEKLANMSTKFQVIMNDYGV